MIKVTDGFVSKIKAEMRAQHPSVAAAQAKAGAAGAAVRAVRLWDDPMFGIAFMAARRSMRQDDGDIMAMAEQSLPRRKLFQAQVQKADSERAARTAELHGVSVNLEREVAHSVLELALMDETIVLSEEQVKWMEKMAATARERAIDPQGSAADPMKLEASLAKDQQMLASMRLERESMARRINVNLGRPMTQNWPRLVLPNQPGQEPSLKRLLESITRQNPHVAAMSHMADAAAAGVNVAEHERDPVFSIGVEGAGYSGGDFRQATIGIKMTLPWFNDPIYRANEERARLEHRAALLERDALERNMRAEVVMDYTQAEKAGQLASRYAGEIIPLLAKTAENVESAWVSSKAMLMEVLIARNELLGAQMEQRRQLAAQRAALEMLRAHVPGDHHAPGGTR